MTLSLLLALGFGSAVGFAAACILRLDTLPRWRGSKGGMHRAAPPSSYSSPPPASNVPKQERVGLSYDDLNAAVDSWRPPPSNRPNTPGSRPALRSPNARSPCICARPSPASDGCCNLCGRPM